MGSPKLPTPRVLVADDDAMNRIVARAMLESLGASVDDARDGSQAVLLASRHDYELILMDLEMPVMDGITATRRIRALPNVHRSRVPIYAASCAPQDWVDKQVRESGMSGQVQKPYLGRELAHLLGIAMNAPA